jgi:hypothetical protein
MMLDSTEDGFCQQENLDRWMIASVTDMGKRYGTVLTGAYDEIARFLHPR